MVNFTKIGITQGKNYTGELTSKITSLKYSIEDDLRKIEKAVLTNLNQIVTVFWKKSNSSNPYECEITLDFDAKLPYDRYPLQGLLEGGLKK